MTPATIGLAFVSFLNVPHVRTVPVKQHLARFAVCAVLVIAMALGAPGNSQADVHAHAAYGVLVQA